MAKFCANLSLLFNEYDWPQRFEAAASAGFDAIEIQFPYHIARDELRRLLQHNKQRLALINMPAGNWEAGERGIACLPDREQEFKQGVEQAIDYALFCNCRRSTALPVSARQSYPKPMPYN
ncbi:MAG: TIM barrel protein [Halopseudomonas sp.]